MGWFDWLRPSTNKADLDDIPTKTACYHIEGFLSCSYFHLATEVADRLSAKHPHVKSDVSAYIKQQWAQRSRELQEEFNTRHRTSPFIYEGCSASEHKMVGGYTEFAEHVRKTYKMNVPRD
ncbi:hypothetical protein BCR43DRAFT_508146 [Syncephalastrum racemosum]|uniref:Uncharacterized protein n=1 Tax=Syncephalastrum racemosum TaxID=13706 RepID=A0A1X2H2H2_SYNRA|nr:hypothetical protein BCR43DRAFT_508146 [Syncephalastrum racemosum]